MPSATRTVDPNDLASRNDPDDTAEARMRKRSEGAWMEQGSGRTKQQALAAMARDREIAPAGELTRRARTTDAADLDDEVAAQRRLREQTENAWRSK